VLLPQMFEVRLNGAPICPENCSGLAEPFCDQTLMGETQKAALLCDGDEEKMLAQTGNTPRSACFHGEGRRRLEVATVRATRVNR
jgi:hypothetical protein